MNVLPCLAPLMEVQGNCEQEWPDHLPAQDETPLTLKPQVFTWATYNVYITIMNCYGTANSHAGHCFNTFHKNLSTTTKMQSFNTRPDPRSQTF